MDIEEVFLGAGHHVAGNLSFEELKEMSEDAIRGPGVCSGMGTANSMHIVCEALGLSLPGAAPVLANSERMFQFAESSGRRIVEMVWENLCPRDILTASAFANAAMAVLAVSGSINCIKHLQATAIEARCDIDIYELFERFGKTVPVLSAVRPIGDTSIEDFERAGGAAAMLKRLEGVFHLDAMTVSGKTQRQNLDETPVPDDDTIRPMDRPLSDKASIVVMRGSLAPAGGIIKLGLRAGKKLKFTGRARVFNSSEEAVAGLRDGKIIKGDVVIVRGLGLKGGPGMGMASRVVFAIDGAGLGADVAMITDGQLSGLVNKGLVIGEVNPEAAVGGPLALVQDGDGISIDVEAQRVDLNVPETELALRSKQMPLMPAKPDEGWLSVYARSVLPLSQGGSLIKPGESRG
jgi:dihydroxy-acid dehydratase